MKTCIAIVLLAALLTPTSAAAEPPAHPNIILVFIDDMGWGDFSCFGNTEAKTTNIDQLAAEGLRFKQFYVNSPICSPSRVAISTGQYPQRWRITSFLNNRKNNRERGMAQWLDPKAPMLSRILKMNGYATGHFGKWHMGGQRDVTDAPPISAYGFDESLTNFEGMGAKLLPLTEVPAKNGGIKKGRIWEKAEILGEPVTWMLRSKITGGFVDRAIGFIDKAQQQDRPFYINLWPDDVHAPLFPSVKRWSEDGRQRYLAVLEEMDAQFAKLFDRVRNDPKLRDNTVILICSDNGPEQNCGSAGPFRGIKATLYEGGIRSPLIVWAPGLMTAKKLGTENSSSVFAAIDIPPSLLALAGIDSPAATEFDGDDLSATLLGRSTGGHKAPIFFRRPPDRAAFRAFKNLPDLAMRSGKWKLLCDYDGSEAQLHDLTNDPGETTNLASKHPDIVKRLTRQVLTWNKSMPADNGPKLTKQR